MVRHKITHVYQFTFWVLNKAVAMLYNKDLKKPNKTSYCMKCKHFNRAKKQCEGIGKTCFLYDPKTKTVIDPITKLPIKIN